MFDSIEYVRGDDRNGRLRNLIDLKRELDALVAKYGGTTPDAAETNKNTWR
jgi:hypothetical protein